MGVVKMSSQDDQLSNMELLLNYLPQSLESLLFSRRVQIRIGFRMLADLYWIARSTLECKHQTMEVLNYRHAC
jgi:hypothetical protein